MRRRQAPFGKGRNGVRGSLKQGEAWGARLPLSKGSCRTNEESTTEGSPRNAETDVHAKYPSAFSPRDRSAYLTLPSLAAFAARATSPWQGEAWARGSP